MKKLTYEECNKALSRLSLWKRVEGREAFMRIYEFKDFNEAFAWMTRMALFAEKIDHHPEWCNAWNRVEVILTTHDVKGVTEKDVIFAEFMETCWQDS